MESVSRPILHFALGERHPMAGYARSLARNLRRPAFAALTAMALAVSTFTAPALARGPDAIADVAESVIDAVVNISTSQTIDAKVGPMPQLPPGSPFEEFFDEFFKNRRGQQGENRPGDNRPGDNRQGDNKGDNNQGRDRALRRVNSLGSG